MRFQGLSRPLTPLRLPLFPLSVPPNSLRSLLLSFYPQLTPLLRPQLFTRPTAALLFPPMQLSRWSFDVELLVLADICRLGAASFDSTTPTPTTSFKVPLAETPIQWHEVPGSKISLAWDSLGMARDLVVLRCCLGIGRWEAPVLRVESEGKKE